MEIKFISVVLFVKDIQAARRFYEELLDQKVLLDFGVNLEFTGGFSLSQRDHAWETIFPQAVDEPLQKNKTVELYFETNQLDAVCQRLQAAGVEWIQTLQKQPWGAYAARFYDPDGHILELSEPMSATVARLVGQGLTVEEVAQKTVMPLDVVRKIAAG